ncbi:MAG: Asp-tRNA(Asn)/Glu-tRNA(Gln) amidotransferase subunit GatB [Patescibacteria group bacterium]
MNNKYNMMFYQPVIGLEIHCELKTKGKMFCGCPNNPDEVRANFNVCPVCLGHPGTLPVINRQAVESVLKLGLALGGKIPAVSRFDRKSYFYPDLPKGYQISQYKQPLVKGGSLAGVKITRIHLEEDTGALSHDKKNHSLVDFNRAGIPLMELVTEPDIRNAEEAVIFAKELQLILRYLGISDANMEKGQMRIEVNISVSNDDKLGTKAEIKNLNSFRAVEESIKYEIKRQTEILEQGGKNVQETRGWDDVRKETVSQRFKEESHDYRYFPEPDLPPIELSSFDLDNLKNEIPELPAEKRIRFEKKYGLTAIQTEIIIEDIRVVKYFEEAAGELKFQILNSPATRDTAQQDKFQILYNYLTSDLFGLMAEQGVALKDLKIVPKQLAELVGLIMENEISSRIAKDVLKEMFLTGLSPRQIVQEKELSQISDVGEIENVVKKIIAENLKAVEDYKKGKENILQFLIGKAIADLRGRGNPEVIKKIFKKLI